MTVLSLELWRSSSNWPIYAHQHNQLVSNMMAARYFNPFKPSVVKWLHFKVFGAILV